MSSCVSEIESLVGLDHAKNAVRRVLSSASGVHAVLLYGPKGAGKGRLARFLACSWMCTDPRDGLACGECGVCKAFRAGRAVDFQVIAPWGPSSMIKLSALRPVKKDDHEQYKITLVPVSEFFRTRPLAGRNKVVLLEQAHRMNSDSANAFLKTLEEPGPTSKIILSTDEYTRVIPTLRSRCMCVACELPRRGSEPASGSPAELVFGQSPGGVAHVRELSELFDRLYALLDGTRGQHWGSAFKAAEECRSIADAYAKATGEPARLANVRILEFVGDWLAMARPEQPELLKSVSEAHRRAQGNAQATIVFENLFLDLLYHG